MLDLEFNSQSGRKKYLLIQIFYFQTVQDKYSKYSVFSVNSSLRLDSQSGKTKNFNVWFLNYFLLYFLSYDHSNLVNKNTITGTVKSCAKLLTGSCSSPAYRLFRMDWSFFPIKTTAAAKTSKTATIIRAIAIPDIAFETGLLTKTSKHLTGWVEAGGLQQYLPSSFATVTSKTN